MRSPEKAPVSAARCAVGKTSLSGLSERTPGGRAVR